MSNKKIIYALFPIAFCLLFFVNIPNGNAIEVREKYKDEERNLIISETIENNSVQSNEVQSNEVQSDELTYQNQEAIEESANNVNKEEAGEIDSLPIDGLIDNDVQEQDNHNIEKEKEDPKVLSLPDPKKESNQIESESSPILNTENQEEEPGSDIIKTTEQGNLTIKETLVQPNTISVQSTTTETKIQDYFVVSKEINVYGTKGGSQTVGKLFEGKYKILDHIDQHWISISYAGSTGYIRSADVQYSDSLNFQKPNPGLPVHKDSLSSSSSVTIYSGANEKESKLGILHAGQKFATFGTYGPEFIVIDIGGRMAYVKRKYFQSNDQYFSTERSETPVYADTTGKSSIGHLSGANEVYRLLKVVNDKWAQLHFAGASGYIRIQDVAPKKEGTLKNADPGLKVHKSQLTSTSPLTVYAQASEKGSTLGMISAGGSMSTFGTYGPEFMVLDIGGRMVYVKRKYFQSNDQYFSTERSETPVYADTTGKSSIGHLSDANEVYRLLKVVNDKWAQLHFAGTTGYIRIQDVAPKKEGTLKNADPGLKVHKSQLTSTSPLTVYAQASEKGSTLGMISAGGSMSTFGTYGPEFMVLDIGGRMVYVKRKYFQSNDQYFSTERSETPIYADTTGKSSIGHLSGANEVYRLLKVVNDKWAQLHFAGTTGYIRIQDVAPKKEGTLKNADPGLKVHKSQLTSTSPLTVYAQASEKGSTLGMISAGGSMSTFGTYGPEFMVLDIGGRMVYVKRKYFQSNDQYFSTERSETPIYADTTGKSSIGHLSGANEVYRLLKVVNDKWAQLHFAGTTGYIRIQDIVPKKEGVLENGNPGLTVHQKGLKGYKNLLVYHSADTSSSIIGTINYDIAFETLGTYNSDFIVVDLGGRLAYVETSSLNSSIITTTQYSYRLTDLLNKQMNIRGTPPQDWYTNYKAYISSQALQKVTTNGKTEWLVVGADVWNVRSGPGTSYHILGTFKKNDKVLEIFEIRSDGWIQINYYKTLEFTRDKNNNVVYREKYRPFVNASEKQTAYYLNPENFKDDPIKKYQFLDLSQTANINEDEVNQKFLSNAGTLTNKASIFVEAAKRYNISEIYLISHALLETGNGKSVLASGVPIKVTNNVVRIVDPNKEAPDHIVYNMYGIGAYDNCPNLCGAQRAFEQKWFSPDVAIIEGAKFVSENYVHAGQNTLYKMRWNPDNPGTHQYATDIAWATKQTTRIYDMYSKLSYKREVFDITIFL
ncbi:SH3 domain-containing protein [Siminovitchia sediminis]|uniref:SH3 domain-containing protein n=1 Tax=Siminovitchia sediminis TaxID=1274353 RepID=A0ABW4KMA0_9BACI